MLGRARHSLFAASALAMALLAGQAHAQAVISVSPSGGDDTAAIQTAFDAAVAAGPGSIVQLEKGTFCVSSPIIVRGFDGAWLGNSRETTTVKTCAETFPVPLDIVADPAYPADPAYQVLAPFVFLEVEGKPATNLSIADMTIHLEGETNPWYAHGNPEPLTIFRPAVHVLGKRPSVVDGDISSVAVFVDNITMRASADGIAFGDPSWSNIDNGFEIVGGIEGNINLATDVEPIQASVSVTRSHFDQVAFSAVQVVRCVDCDVVIGGSKMHGNTFEKLYGAPLFGGFIGKESSVEISHNKGETQFEAGSLVTLPALLSSSPVPAATGPTTINISHNKIDLFSHFFNPSYGLILEDVGQYFGEKTMQASVTHNKIKQIDIGYGKDAFGSIIQFAGQDSDIRENDISGDFQFAGIWLGFVNNVSAINNELHDTTGGMAPIWLGPNSSNNLVEGKKVSGLVLDEGTNNIIKDGKQK